ncbi:hypothetical protein D3C72_2461510 [compost metagenome]
MAANWGEIWGSSPEPEVVTLSAGAGFWPSAVTAAPVRSISALPVGPILEPLEAAAL